jgi:hypothetical protein
MRRLLLAAAATCIAALTVTPFASAHTGTATITCDSVTFSFTQFKDPTTVIREIVRIDGVKVVDTNFTLVGPSGSNVVSIDVPPGTHTVEARASWTDSEGDSFFRVSHAVFGCEESGACTFTKGYYRNHASVTASIIAAAGGSLLVGNRNLPASSVQAILDATPGKPGIVTFSPNLLLNLAQQLIAAELNVARNASTPSAVIEAINEANMGIRVNPNGGTIALRTTLTQTAMTDLVSTLSRFNEGGFAEAEHCDS